MPKSIAMKDQKQKNKNKSELQQKAKKSQQNKKSPLRTQSKKQSKQSKDSKLIKMAPAAGTLLLLILIFLFYGMTILLSPKMSIPAEIKVVSGGYKLTYKICEISTDRLPNDVKVGDKFYIDTHGRYQSSPRNGIKVKVVSIDQDKGIVYTDFVASDMPTYLSKEEYQDYYQGSSTNSVHSTVYVVGKFAFKKFILNKIIV